MSAKTEDVEAAINRLELAAARALRLDIFNADTADAADLRTVLTFHAAQAERIVTLEAGIRLIRAAAQGDGHAHLIVKECNALLSGKAT